MAYKKIFFTILFFFLISCSAVEKKETVDELYESALENIQSGNYYTAIELLEKIDADYPYSEFSDRSEMLIAFIKYLKKDYAQSALLAEKFIKLRPGNAYVSYMYFLRAESYLKQRSDYLRDQTMIKESKKYFMQLLARFGENKYSKYSRKAIDLIDDDLANFHLDVGRVNQKRQEYISAINRFNKVIETFPQSKYTAESYFRLVETYYAMGLKEQAQYESQILNQKYPDNIWNRRSLLFIKNHVTKAIN